ncbi:endoribonuclease XendoU, partial [Cooperia oncophora]
MSRKLRALDVNKAEKNQVRVDFQSYTKPGDPATDNAPKNLFTTVDNNLLSKPTYRAFLALTNNFYRETGKAEPRVTKQEVCSRSVRFHTIISLFTTVDNNLLSKPTYRAFLALTNNFYRETGKAEPRVTKQEEEQETKTFLAAVLQSKPMQAVYSFLNTKKHPFATSPAVFEKWLKQLWFEHYSRANGVPDSSAFEHVFIG